MKRYLIVVEPADNDSFRIKRIVPENVAKRITKILTENKDINEENQEPK